MNKKTLYKIHRFAGLTLGFFLFLLGVSGTAITFREELLPKSYPELFNVKPDNKPLPVFKLYESALVYKSSTQEITNLYTSHHEDEAYMLMIKDSEKKFPLIWTINPYSGEIMGEMSMIKNFYAVMLMIHTNFLAGKVGSYLVGILGLVLTFFIISGLIIFTPKKSISVRYKGLLTFKWSSQKIHHQLGVIAGIPLLLSALTGMFIVFDLPYYSARLFKSPPRIEEAEEKGNCYYPDQLNVLKSISPLMENRLISIHFCSEKNRLMKITYGQSDRDFLDGYVREVIDPDLNLPLQVFDSQVDPKSWNFKRLLIYPIHTGQYFGFIGRMINFLLGLTLTLLFLTGIRLSIKRAGLKIFNKDHSGLIEAHHELQPFQNVD